MQFYSVGILKSTSQCIFNLLVIFVCFVLVQNIPCHVQSGMKKNLTAVLTKFKKVFIIRLKNCE